MGSRGGGDARRAPRWGPAAGTNGAPATADEIEDLTGRISRSIFKLGSDINLIKKLVARLGKAEGASASELEAELNDVQQETRSLIRETAQNLKDLAQMENIDTTTEQRLQRTRLSTDFTDLLKTFERVEKSVAKKERELVTKSRAVVSEKTSALIHLEDDAGYNRGALPLAPSSQIQRQQQIELEMDIESNEHLIAQREKGIEEIERTIIEINELFRDLGSLVHEQGYMLDNIEANIVSASQFVETGTSELHRANDYQRRSRRRLCCVFGLLASILGFLVLILVLARAI